jgi:hypothetical protein
MKRPLLTLLPLLGLLACGGLSDPNKSEPVATISGALTGTSVPANARVALVWRKNGGGHWVGADAPLVGGKFSFALNGAPPDDVISELATDSSSPESADGTTGYAGDGNGRTAQPVATPGPASARIATGQTNVSGSLSQPLSGGVAGFVVYADKNGNGQLDLVGNEASSPDQILGGASELLVAYLQDGTTLDYEKLRDGAAQLPARGYNLMWTKERWLPLNAVELTLKSNTKLPGAVCSNSRGIGYDTTPTSEEPPSMPSGGTGGTTTGIVGYPSKGDPTLNCALDGRSFTYTAGYTCGEQPPTVNGLCTSSYPVRRGCAENSGFLSIKPNQPVPEGWPCDVPDGVTTPNGGGTATTPMDAGTPPADPDANPADGG